MGREDYEALIFRMLTFMLASGEVAVDSQSPKALESFRALSERSAMRGWGGARQALARGVLAEELAEVGEETTD